MADMAAINNFIDGFSEIFGPAIADALKGPVPQELFAEIQDGSGKTAAEAVLVLMYGCKYLSGDKFVLPRLVGAGELGQFLLDNRPRLLEIGRTRRVQGNAPDRALPVLEVFGRQDWKTAPTVIELGSSYGLIGHCLLEPDALLAEPGIFFGGGQQLPVQARGAGRYLGVDLAPPDRDWLLACIFDPEVSDRISRVLGRVQPEGRHAVIAGSALGFASYPQVRACTGADQPLVVLTSFMLYQLPVEMRTRLRDEILAFCRAHGADWYNQDVAVDKQGEGRYFVEWNGRRVMHLADDKCSAWDWVNDGD